MDKHSQIHSSQQSSQSQSRSPSSFGGYLRSKNQESITSTNLPSPTSSSTPLKSITVTERCECEELENTEFRRKKCRILQEKVLPLSNVEMKQTTLTDLFTLQSPQSDLSDRGKTANIIAAEDTKFLPGVGSFKRVFDRQIDNFRVDKTHYIKILEHTGQPCVSFLVPRRFGKTLWLDTLAH